MNDDAFQWFAEHKAQIHTHLLKHLVGFSWVDSPLPHDQSQLPQRVLQASGFLARSDGFAFAITAGHVTKYLLEAAQIGRHVSSFRITDGFQDGDCRYPLVYPISELPPIVCHDDAQGYDYGAFGIDTVTLRAFERSGTAPIEESNWSDVVQNYDAVVMLGFPSQETFARITRNGESATAHLQWACPLLLLEHVPEPPPELLKPHTRLVSRIVTREGKSKHGRIYLESVKGMSGGPIFGLIRKGNEIEYHLLAIQSAEANESSLVIGCFAAPFLRALGKHIRDRFEEEKRQAG